MHNDHPLYLMINNLPLYLTLNNQPLYLTVFPIDTKKKAVFIIIIIKKDWQCKAGRGRLTPYQSEDPSPTLPTYRGKEEKGKIVEDKRRREQLGQQKGIGPAPETRQSHTIE